MKTLFTLLARLSSMRLQAVPYDVSPIEFSKRVKRMECDEPELRIFSAIAFNKKIVTTVRGRLVCSDDGSGVAGVRVTVTFPDADPTDGNPPETITVVTDENGDYVAVSTRLYREGTMVTAEVSGGDPVTKRITAQD